MYLHLLKKKITKTLFIFVFHAGAGYTYKPRLQKSSTFILESLCVRIYPSVEEVDKFILENFLKEHEADGSSNKYASKAQIAQRRLQANIYLYNFVLVF